MKTDIVELWRQLLGDLPRKLWHAFSTTDVFYHNLQLATSLTAFEYETLLMSSGITFKKGNVTMFSKAQLDHLQEGLKKTMAIHISRSKIERSGKALFFIAVDKPDFCTPKEQVNANQSTIPRNQHGNGLDDNSKCLLQRLCDERIAAVATKEREEIEKTNIDRQTTTEDLALTIEEHQPQVLHELVRSVEHPVHNNTTSAQTAETIVPFPAAPKICIGLNNSRVEQFARVDFAYCAKYWSNCRGWRSQTCELSFVPQVSTGDDTKQCRSCVSARKNIRSDRHPLLFQADEDGDHRASLAATTASLQDYILKLFESNKENISSRGELNDKMRSAATALVALKEHSPLQLSNGRLLCFCFGCSEKDDTCETYFTRSRINTNNDILLCSACEQKETSKKKRDARRVLLSHDDNTAPSSHCNVRWMTKEQFAERYNKLKKENLRMASNLKRVANEISDKTKHVDLCLTEESRNVFSAAIDSAQSEQGRRIIKDTLTTLLESTASSTQEAAASCSEFVDAIAEEMTAFSTKLKSGDKLVRFSPRVLRVALSMYLKSPKTYKEFKSSSVLCLPSISTLKKLKQSRSVNDGICLKIYERHKEQRIDDFEVGHLICDEMKLVEGLLWNTSTHQVQGFACDDINDLASLLKRFSSEEETEEIATSVNQWRFRSVLGKIFNCEFFSNRGTLNGDNLLLQFLHVVLACEAIRCEVWGFLCDAGGNNARLFKFLRNGKTSKEPWLPAEMVTTTNPFDPSRKIAIWHCVTHVLKALRNAFHSSMPKGTRNFIDAAGNPFGFQFIVDALHRDELRAVPKTDLSKKAVYIEGWSAMNVAAAKSVFSERTITEGITYVSGKLNTTVMVSTIKEIDNEYTISACHKQNLQFGLLYGAVWELKEKAVDSNATIKSELASLEYMAVVGALFNELLMNRNEGFTLANIDSRMTYLKFYLRYFHDWSESSKLRKRAGENKEWQKYFLSSETWLNLRICITGYLTYSANVLNQMKLMPSQKEEKIFVPVLCGNSSTIEAWFSCVRGNNCSTLQTYCSGVGSVDASKGILFLQNNKAYAAVDVPPEEAEKIVPSGVFQSIEKHREEYLNKWLAAVKENKQINNDQPILPYGAGFHGGTCQKSKELFHKLCSKKSNGHFGYIIAADAQFMQWVRLSFQSPEQAWYDALITFSMDDNKKFDEFCQVILQKIFKFTVEYLRQKQNACSCLELALYNYIATTEFSENCKKLPTSMLPHKQICCVVLLLALSRLHNIWMHDELSHNKKLNDPNTNTEADVDVPSEVINFVGWAISDLLKQSRDKRKGEECKEDVSHDGSKKTKTQMLGNQSVQCLECMRILHQEAMEDSEYINKYYSPDAITRNQGGLALVSRPFIEWAENLMLVIRRTCTYENVASRRKNCISLFYDEVVKAMETDKKEDFHRIMCACLETRKKVKGDEKVTEEAIEIVRCKIITKVFHARSNIAFQKYKDEHTGRFATKRKKESGLAFRQELKSVTSRKKDDDKENQSNIVNETSTKKTKKRKTKSSAKKQAEAILLKK